MLSVERSISDLGRVGYDEGVRIQREVHARRLSGGVPDTLLLCEHPPVYTLGTNASAGDVLAPRAPVVRSDRGGKVTFHGPGQVVGYVICDLRRRGWDVQRFCGDLEEVMIRALSDFGLAGERIRGLTGVWLGREKVGALGVRVRRWVTMHGFALNVDCDLSYYEGIVPCGIADRGVTSMARALAKPVDRAAVAGRCGVHFAEIFLGG
ncbi:MAG: lipoyl(octanoyl) transferase LipB [Planctomycetota bacterium]